VSQIKIKKARSKGTLFRSANWEVADVPGLHLRQVRIPQGGNAQDMESTTLGSPNRSWNKPCWHFWTIAYDLDGNNICCDLAYQIEEELKDQCFPTRREALQAVEAILIMEAGSDNAKA